jgi:hypothetical protein
VSANTIFPLLSVSLFFFGAPPFPLIITGEQQFRYNQKGDWKRKRHEERLQTLKGDTFWQTNLASI